MFYAVSTKDGFKVTPHATEEAAAQHLIDSLLGDYDNDFWIENGRLVKSSSSRVDFSLNVYEGHGELIQSVAYLDEPATALLAIAEALTLAEEA